MQREFVKAPMYQQLNELLRELIRSREFVAGDQFDITTCPSLGARSRRRLQRPRRLDVEAALRQSAAYLR